MRLHTKILIGLGSGAIVGAVAHGFARDSVVVAFFVDSVAAPAGQVFLRLLLMTVVPLVFASVALGAGAVGDVRRLGRMGGRTLAFFLLSTILATALGLALVSVFRPGGDLDPAIRGELVESYRGTTEAMASSRSTTFGIQMFVEMVPRNPVDAAARMDMLGVIVFSLFFGAALAMLPAERSAPMMRFLESLGDVIVKIIDMVMQLAPYGVFALIFVVTYRFGWHLLLELAGYVVLVVAGLAVHGLVTLSILVRTLGGISPLEFWKRSRTAALTAFSTSSSNATLPTNLAVARRLLGVPSRVAGFVLPLGATMNMNGTALYEGVTVLFLAQVFGVELSLGQQAVVLLLSVVTAIGAAGVPGGSLPLIMVVLATVGVPAEGIGIILGVDRLLDMCRTTLNVTGDLAASVYVARADGSLEPLPRNARLLPDPD